MEQRLQKVRIEDFNVAALRKAAREGRLYIEPAVECQINVEELVLKYVTAIEANVTSSYRDIIREVWRLIVSHPQIAPMVSKIKPFNKYTVTSIAIYLNNQGFYAFSTATALHLQLEHTKKRNRYYTSASYYEPDMKALRQIIQEVKQR